MGITGNVAVLGATGTLPERESEKVTRDLRRMIVGMELPPGALITQVALCGRLRCGRTPLREALQVLAQEGLLTLIPGSGISIAGLNIHDYIDLHGVTVALVQLAARLAATRVGDEDIQRLRDILEKAEAKAAERDFSALALLDFEFHSTVARMTGNGYLVDCSDRLLRLTARYSSVTWHRAGSCGQTLEELRKILAALETRNPMEVEQATLNHFANGNRRSLAGLLGDNERHL